MHQTHVKSKKLYMNKMSLKKLASVFIVINIFQYSLAQITLCTYNIRYDNPSDGINSWANRLPHLSAQLKSIQCDFLGTQEGLYHQLSQLSDSLGQNYTWIGVGRDSGNRAGEHCAIFYRRDKFEIISLKSDFPQTFWLSTTPKIPSKGWDAALPRIATGALFKEISTGKMVFVLNTHFDHVGQKAREESVKLIWNFVGPLIQKKIPVAVMGDFNLPDTSQAIQWISHKLYDTRNLNATIEYPKGTFNGFEPLHTHGKRIDYIFTSPEIKPLSYRIDDRQPAQNQYFSDHYPVITTLNFNP